MSSIRSYFMAKFYDATMKKSEALCLGRWRAELLEDVAGEVLEIGSGTGVNIDHYPGGVSRLVLSEPDVNMRRLLEERIEKAGRSGTSVLASGAESIASADDTYDHVVSMLVLCSVDDQAESLSEVFRVLRPGGSLVFLEHVLAKRNPRLARWQKFFQPLWRFMCGNCHLTCDTEKAILEAGFHIEELEEVTMLGASPVVQPMIKGYARKSAMKREERQ